MSVLKEFQRFEPRPFGKEHVSFSDEQREHVSFTGDGPLLKMLELFEISHGSYQLFTLLFNKLIGKAKSRWGKDLEILPPSKIE